MYNIIVTDSEGDFYVLSTIDESQALLEYLILKSLGFRVRKIYSRRIYY